MGEAPFLFKEKINFKLPGGAGFAAHQDAPAFTSFGQRYHITLLVAIDGADAENGCLEFSDPVPVYETLPQTPGGTIDPEIEARLPWRPLPVEPGDLVFFDSYLPHRSGPNRSARARRALYITYNRASEGNVRDEYVVQKRTHFPPEVERLPGVDYSAKKSVFNLGNPIR
jgi:ectoine hydroxylase-related dioxygenase (phytanoyl-CoA dioxygenase family)